MLRTSDRDVEAALYLAYCLHPDPTWKIPTRIVAEAFEWAAIRQQTQERRPAARHPYKPVMPDAALFQLGVYRASSAWERDQESAEPQREPVYRPTADDLLVRYLAFLVAKTVELNSRHVAVGLGCHLYRYRPLEISGLAPTLFDEGNIKRVKGRIGRWIKERFPAESCFPINGRRTPSDHERALVRKALIAFAPWGVPHLSPNSLILDSYFGDDSPQAEWERIHLLVDPKCAGLVRLIAEYNESLTRSTNMRLDDPDNKLEVPEFGNAAPPQSSDRFTPARLTARELTIIKEAMLYRFDLNQRRRRQFSAGLLSVRAEGEVISQFAPGRENCQQLPVPLSASYLEVYGQQEEEEELLLAVFPLPGPEADEPAHFFVHENGWSFELTVYPLQEENEEANERLVRLEYGAVGALIPYHLTTEATLLNTGKFVRAKESLGLVKEALKGILTYLSQPKAVVATATTCLALFGIWAALQPPALQMEWVTEPSDKGFRCYYSADGQPTELRLDFRTSEPGDFLVVLTSDYYQNRAAELHSEDSADPEHVVARLPLEKHPAAAGRAYGEIEVRHTRRLLGRQLPDEVIFKGPLPSCEPALQK